MVKIVEGKTFSKPQCVFTYVKCVKELKGARGEGPWWKETLELVGKAGRRAFRFLHFASPSSSVIQSLFENGIQMDVNMSLIRNFSTPFKELCSTVIGKVFTSPCSPNK